MLYIDGKNTGRMICWQKKKTGKKYFLFYSNTCLGFLILTWCKMTDYVIIISCTVTVYFYCAQFRCTDVCLE